MQIAINQNELATLVSRLDEELQKHICSLIWMKMPFRLTEDLCVEWREVGNEMWMTISCNNMMVEVRSIVVPVNFVEGGSLEIALSGGRLEVTGAWRVDSKHPWLRNESFGDVGTQVFTLASFEPEHIETTAATIVGAIRKYLQTQLAIC